MDERSNEVDAIVCRDRVKITAAVAVYNEEAHIGRCLDGLLAQRCSMPFEVLVIDGMSTDRTAEIVHSFARIDSRVKLIKNGRRLQVFAWNMALRDGQGEYFAMILGHAEYDPDYFESCLRALERNGAAGVGGVQRPHGSGVLGNAIAWCMSSPLGMGNARFRYTTKEEEAGSVFSIFAKADRLRSIGGYDESLPFDEDSDLNYRLRQAGGKLIVSPDIRVRYHVRRSLRSLWKQMFCYGYWRRCAQLKQKGAVPPRVLAPALLVAGLIASCLLAFTPMRAAALAVPSLYAAFLFAACAASIRRARLSAVAVPGVLATMHVGYGLGWWKAFITRRQRARSVAAAT
jgi:succinoglycan biosynthesis protein ExoA